MRERLVIVSVAAGMVALIGCNDVNPAAQAPEQEAGTARLTSVVQLGDSIASGEGTLYGYQWDEASQTWTGGDVDVQSPPPYPDCHVSPDAYGNVVATYFGTQLHQFACTGATFAAGITTPEMDGNDEMRPAQFGDWDAKTDLNEDYDDAAPQLVLITLGADDLQFASIVEDCIKNGYKYYWHLADLECVDQNPGQSVQTKYVDVLPTVEKSYATLVKWIQDRATANNAPQPKVVFTNYANPFPPNGAECNDTNWLYPEQLKYLSSLVDQINGIIMQTISGLNDPNVAVADISGAYVVKDTSHTWCTDAPWAYGLSIYSVSSPSSFWSQAPFHPTPDGQESIAEHVIPVVHQWFAQPNLPETPPPSTLPITDPDPTTSQPEVAPTTAEPNVVPTTTD